MSVLSIYAHMEWAFHRKAVAFLLTAIALQTSVAQTEKPQLSPSAVSAADKTAPVIRATTHNRPKIGLVLSGGARRRVERAGGRAHPH